VTTTDETTEFGAIGAYAFDVRDVLARHLLDDATQRCSCGVEVEVARHRQHVAQVLRTEVPDAFSVLRHGHAWIEAAQAEPTDEELAAFDVRAAAAAAAGWVWPNSTLVDVEDGDTFTALVTRDLGFGGHVTFPATRLRVARCNAPSTKYLPGKYVRERVLAWFALAGPLTITTIKPYAYGGPSDSPGEWMAEVVNAAGENLSDWLLAQSFAQPYDGKGPRPDDRGTKVPMPKGYPW
jgi:endonuclease YncB( thermonuclease family)